MRQPNQTTTRGQNLIARLRDVDSGACRFFILLGFVLLFSCTVLLSATWITTTNEIDQRQFTLAITPKKVLPRIAAEDLPDPLPFATGEITFDCTQREVSWKIYHSLGDGLTSPLASIDVRGPLRQNGDDFDNVAPVVIGLGLGEDRKNRFSGTLDIEEKVVRRIVRDPYLYYVALSDEAGAEIARDSLDKMIFSST